MGMSHKRYLVFDSMLSICHGWSCNLTRDDTSMSWLQKTDYRKVKMVAVRGRLRAANFFGRMARTDIEALIEAFEIFIRKRIVHMCPLGGGGGELLRAEGTNNHRRYRYILRSQSALAADCSHVPPGGRRGRALASGGDKWPSEIPLYSALKERIGNGLFTCAPWGAEGASHSERRGQQPSEIPLYIALVERVCWRMIILKSIR